ncbi:MAG: transporter substrate-binding domain-containing protein [Armatimonadetes bacterium]|nr:transporter substrate-binding domain-containing protein [Armatimonadota bacterium]
MVYFRYSPRPRAEAASICRILGAALFLASLVASAPCRAADPVTAGSEVDYPPFCIVDARGRATGFSVELMEAALRSMGRGVAWKTGVWADVKTWPARGVVQALPMVARTPEREPRYDFTFPYMTQHGAIVVRQNQTGIRRIDDLAGRDVAVMKGDISEEFMLGAGTGARLHSVATFPEALRQLAAGRYDAVVIQRLLAARLIGELGLTNLAISDQPLEGFQQVFCFAVKEGDRDTLAVLNEGLSLVIANGAYAHLHAKWFAALELPTRRRLVIGGDDRFPPYEFLDAHGLPAGLNVDLARAVAREVGLDIEIKLGPWEAARKGLETGQFDALGGLAYSPDRALRVDFAPPHTMLNYVAVVRPASGAPPETVAQLRGRSLAVQRDDMGHDMILRLGLGDRAAAVGSQKEAIQRVVVGTSDCAVVTRLAALEWERAHGSAELRIGRRPVLSVPYGFAVAKGNGALLAQISEGLKTLAERGELRRIHDKWLGPDDEPNVAVVLRYAAMVAGPLLLALLGGVLWVRSLRRQVALRTASLSQSVRQFQLLLEGAPEAIFIQTDYRFHYVNAAACRLFGAAGPQELIGRPVMERFHADYHAAIADRIRRLNEEREPAARIRQTWLRLDGSEVPVEVSGVPVTFEGSDGALIFARDITDHERMEAQLRQAQKMEAVGRLAGGVAHDFNNMLMAVLNYVELARDAVERDHPVRECLDEIEGVSQRSANLTRQLLAFARRQTIAPAVLDLNAEIGRMLKMLRSLIGEDIELVWKPGDGLWPVKADPSQIDQVLANVSVNARDAMGGPGTLTVETANVTVDAATASKHGDALPGDYVALTLTDTGRGMDADALQHIFEPFYTTKGVGEGTGLGLATVFGIMQQNGGFVSVSSTPGSGTTLRMHFPREAHEAPEAPPPTAAAERPGGGETILLVEDERAIRLSTKRLLERLGYLVLVADAPGEALKVALACAGVIDLLLTDVVMPEMTGRELAARLVEQRPGLRCIFMSGYTANVIAQHGVLDEGVRFLPKPFTRDGLAAAVRAALDDAP